MIAEALERARANLQDGETIDDLTERLLKRHDDQLEVECVKVAVAVRRTFEG